MLWKLERPVFIRSSNSVYLCGVWFSFFKTKQTKKPHQKTNQPKSQLAWPLLYFNVQCFKRFVSWMALSVLMWLNVSNPLRKTSASLPLESQHAVLVWVLACTSSASSLSCFSKSELDHEHSNSQKSHVEKVQGCCASGHWQTDLLLSAGWVHAYLCFRDWWLPRFSHVCLFLSSTPDASCFS